MDNARPIRLHGLVTLRHDLIKRDCGFVRASRKRLLAVIECPLCALNNRPLLTGRGQFRRSVIKQTAHIALNATRLTAKRTRTAAEFTAGAAVDPAPQYLGLFECGGALEHDLPFFDFPERLLAGLAPV